MMVSKAADRLPQLVLRGSAEDLGRLAFSATRVVEEQSPAPRAVVGAAYTKLKRDELISEAERGKLVNHGFTVVENYWPVGLGRHQSTSWMGTGGLKIILQWKLRNPPGGT
jgi:hypothetical protein